MRSSRSGVRFCLNSGMQRALCLNRGWEPLLLRADRRAAPPAPAPGPPSTTSAQRDLFARAVREPDVARARSAASGCPPPAYSRRSLPYGAPRSRSRGAAGGVGVRVADQVPQRVPGRQPAAGELAAGPGHRRPGGRAARGRRAGARPRTARARRARRPGPRRAARPAGPRRPAGRARCSPSRRRAAVPTDERVRDRRTPRMQRVGVAVAPGLAARPAPRCIGR